MVNAAGTAKIRRIAGLRTNKQFADTVGVDPATVSRILAGKTTPGARYIAGCIQAFGLDCFEDLFTVTSSEQDVVA
ncbi:helix-turn-helix DNA binding domain protein [Gordonia phage Ecliptus]|nr:helix-turn-helix DNA binding domain protein [Gordonia phage Ecliptus]